MEIIVIGKNEITEIVEKAVAKAILENTKQKVILLSRNQVRKKLKIGYDKLDLLIANGTIKTTPDGKYIQENEINNFLNISSISKGGSED